MQYRTRIQDLEFAVTNEQAPLMLLEGGQSIVVNVRVEDPGAFTMPWNAVQRYRIDHRPSEVHEMVCAENHEDYFKQGLYPVPQADKPDF